MIAAVVIPSAHLGHWIWVLYAIPLLIVIAGIIRSTRAEKKREREEEEKQGKF
jgi:cytochrome c-type biogenesis protein CcmH/NrfF